MLNHPLQLLLWRTQFLHARDNTPRHLPQVTFNVMLLKALQGAVIWLPTSPQQKEAQKRQGSHIFYNQHDIPRAKLCHKPFTTCPHHLPSPLASPLLTALTTCLHPRLSPPRACAARQLRRRPIAEGTRRQEAERQSGERQGEEPLGSRPRALHGADAWSSLGPESRMHLGLRWDPQTKGRSGFSWALVFRQLASRNLAPWVQLVIYE